MLINSLLLVLFFIASGYVEGCSNRVFGKTNYFKYHVARLIQSLVPFYYMVYMFGWSQLLIALGLISWGFMRFFTHGYHYGQCRLQRNGSGSRFIGGCR